MTERTEVSVISLNIWGGQVRDPLLEFLAREAETTDVFCLSEVFNGGTFRPWLGDCDPEIFSHIQEALPNHQGYYCDEHEQEEGIAMFIGKDLSVDQTGHEFVHRWKNAMVNDDGGTLGRALQYAVLEKERKQFTVAHFHGLWNGEGKDDSQDRIMQSLLVNTIMSTLPNPQILCGDFNLNPNTDSLMILEYDRVNLIKELKVLSTRSDLYKKPGKFADYMLVSEDTKVLDFKVLQDQISDHLALKVKIAI